jgi:putative multicomponent Na+:H+ antiporter subunit B
MDSYVYIITALFPLTAAMVIFQKNPYHALVIRGILGAIAALTYTIYGAADVALTEALVGTLLAITLYAIAVRSSLVLRLGVTQAELADLTTKSGTTKSGLQPVLQDLRQVFDQYYMRVELLPYGDGESLYQALQSKDVHAICLRALVDQPYHVTTRLTRLQEIMQTELTTATVHYKDLEILP